MQGLLITGTDTDVGKTWVACAILRALKEDGISAAAYKPVCSGAAVDEGRTVWSDVEALYEACDRRLDREWIAPQRFVAPLAPHRAAAIEDRSVDADLALTAARRLAGHDLLVVEGAGGLFCPVTSTTTIADLALAWKLPLVIVAANRLGTVNHTLLTCASAWSMGLEIAAVVLNDAGGCLDASAASNREDIERLLGTASAFGGPDRTWRPAPPVLTLRWGQRVVQSRERLLSGLDWRKMASPMRL
jgi:dethiobiotin synthetase